MPENDASCLQEDNSCRKTAPLRSIELRRGRHVMAESNVLCLEEKRGPAKCTLIVYENC
jgi:hypothetical protein